MEADNYYSGMTTYHSTEGRGLILVHFEGRAWAQPLKLSKAAKSLNKAAKSPN